MGWTLRLVETGSWCGSRHHNLFDLGEIVAPCELDAVGLTLAQAKDVLASLQQSVVALQEEGIAWKVRQTTLSENISRTV